jgi:hypothetical protein
MFDISNKTDIIESLQCDISAVAEESTLPSDDVEVSIAQRTEAIVRGLVLILDHHKFPKELYGELRSQIQRYLNNLENEEVWSKHAKSMLAYPLARYLRNELPAEPSHGYLKFHGGLGRWFAKRIKIFNRSNTHLWYSWFQAKRSALPASESIIEKTYEDHYATLSHDDEGDDAQIDRIFQNPDFQEVLTSVRKRMTELYNDSPKFTDLMPSTSACFEKQRGLGGQQGMLRQAVELYDLEYTQDRKTKIHEQSWDPVDELYSMRFYTVHHGIKRETNTVITYRYFPQYEWKDLVNLLNVHKLEDAHRPLNCTIQGVLEPLKVRVISKGEALPYYYMKPLQMAIHTAMRDMDCFKLIGRPLSPTDLLDLVENVPYGDEWFSIDYSGATDGLSWKYSGRIFKYLIGNLPREDYNIAMQVLGPHNLFYPAMDGTPCRKHRGMQRTGQLMGSVLSFPILCLANLGVYLATMIDEHKYLTLENKLKHVLINGDDMLYAAPAVMWKKHIEIAKKVGLKMSVGKAYHHSCYANINSVSLHHDITKYRATPWQISFLNVGLVFGQHKVAKVDSPLINRESGKPEIVIGSPSSSVSDEILQKMLQEQHHVEINDNPNFVVNINTILAGCLPGRQARFLKDILHRSGYEIKRDCMQLVERFRVCTDQKRNKYKVYKVAVVHRNLFIPISLGGMGVEAPVGFNFKTKPIHRYIMNRCIMGHSAPYSLGYPLPGPKHQDDEDVPCAPWMRTPLNTDLSSIGRLTVKGVQKYLTGIVRYTKNITEKIGGWADMLRLTPPKLWI